MFTYSGKQEALFIQQSVEPVFILWATGMPYSFSNKIMRNIPSVFHLKPTVLNLPGTLQIPSALKEEIFPTDGKFTMSSLRLKLVNLDDIVFDYITGGYNDGHGAYTSLSSIYNQRVFLYVGADDFLYSDFIRVFSGRIDSISIDKPGIVSINCVNKFKLMETEIMTNCDGTAPNEVTIQGNPINILVRILVSDFATSGRGIPTQFPIDSKTGTPTGMGFSTGDIDTALLQTERDIWIPAVKTKYQWRNYINGRAWLEEFNQLWGFPFLKKSGGSAGMQIGFRLFHPIRPPATAREWTEKTFLEFPKWKRRYDKLINRVRIFGDWDPDGATEWTLLADKESKVYAFMKSTIGQYYTLEIKSTGLRTSLNGVALASALAQRLLSRYGTGGPEEIEGDVRISEYCMEPGDIISLSLKDKILPNYNQRYTPKTSELFEILSVMPELGKGSVSMKISSSYRRRYAFIHATDSPNDYDSATDAEKKYCYFCDDTDKINGDSGYFII